MWLRVLDCLSRFRLMFACCKSLSHNLRRKYLSMLYSSPIKWFLNVCINIYALFALWLLAGTNWYLMFMVVIVRFKAVDFLLSMKWKHGWIPRLFNSSFNAVKYLIIYLSLLFFIAVVRM